jgi:hypothetical protein
MLSRCELISSLYLYKDVATKPQSRSVFSWTCPDRNFSLQTPSSISIRGVKSNCYRSTNLAAILYSITLEEASFVEPLFFTGTISLVSISSAMSSRVERASTALEKTTTVARIESEDRVVCEDIFTGHYR